MLLLLLLLPLLLLPLLPLLLLRLQLLRPPPIWQKKGCGGDVIVVLYHKLI